MTDEAILAPVAGSDPCGADLRWDQDFMTLAQALDNAVAKDSGDDVVDGERLGGDVAVYEDITRQVLDISKRTKDLRVLAIYAETCWRSGGLPAFADALEAIFTAVETWPEPDTGIHPRADEEDGDLGERAAAFGRLILRIPILTDTVGWGDGVGTARRVETAKLLNATFNAWTARLEPTFGRELPARTEAWDAIRRLIGDVSTSAAAGDEPQPEAADGDVAQPTVVARDAWDVVDQAVELMVAQDRHSPALPLLRLLAHWRNLDIVEISQAMRMSGLSLEQLLDSVSKQLANPG